MNKMNHQSVSQVAGLSIPSSIYCRLVGLQWWWLAGARVVEPKPLNTFPQAPVEQVQLSKVSANGKALLFYFEKRYTGKKISIPAKDFLQPHQILCSCLFKFILITIPNHCSSNLTSHCIQAHPFLICPMTQTFSLPSLISQPCLNCPQVFRIILSSRGRLIISGILS